MNSPYFRLGLALLLWLGPLAREADAQPSKLRVSVFNEAISLPTDGFLKTPLHPGLRVGTEVWSNQATPWRKTWRLDLGYYYHRTIEHGLLLNGAYTFGYAFPFGLQPHLLGGLGYKHSIPTSTTFVQKGEGHEAAGFYLGRSQVNLHLGYGLVYALSDRLSLTMDHTAMVTYAFGPNQGLPMGLHTVLALGVQFNL